MARASHALMAQAELALASGDGPTALEATGQLVRLIARAGVRARLDETLFLRARALASGSNADARAALTEALAASAELDTKWARWRILVASVATTRRAGH